MKNLKIYTGKKQFKNILHIFLIYKKKYNNSKITIKMLNKLIIINHKKTNLKKD